jgi:diguanylate cyclase (GGDEF)-like protein
MGGMGTSGLRRLFARSPDPYLGNDLDRANTLGGLAWVLNAAMVPVLAIAADPDRFGTLAGWGAVAGVVAFSAWSIERLMRRKASFDELLVRGYAAILMLAGLQWLAHGSADFQDLYLLWILTMASIHPIRRVVPYFVLAGVLTAAASLSAGSGTDAIVDIVARTVLWGAIGIITSFVMAAHREQRMELREERERARRLAGVDRLTGLGNRRAFDDTLELQMRRARRRGTALALLLADLDDFKSVNDEHGHMSGDACLRHVAVTIAGEVRRPDACFRWGGDEFAILLDEADLRGAVQVAERLAAAVPAACHGPDGEPMRVTCGTAELDDDMTGEDLVGAADLALMAAKARATALRPS